MPQSIAAAHSQPCGPSVERQCECVFVLLDVQSSGALQPGGLITEGTAGSTGVSLAMVGASRGCCPAYSLNLTPEAPAATAAAASELAGAAGTAAALGVGQRRPQLQPYKTGGVPFLLLVSIPWIHSVDSSMHMHTSVSIVGLPWQWVTLLGDAGSSTSSEQRKSRVPVPGVAMRYAAGCCRLWMSLLHCHA